MNPGRFSTPVPVPFLMMYSNTSPAGNDYAYFPAGNDFHELLVPSSKHVDFIDTIHAFPILKTAGIGTGTIDTNRMTTLVNDIQLAFFDQYLKDIDGAYQAAISRHRGLVTEELSSQRPR